MKNKRFAEGNLSERISFSDRAKPLGEVTGEIVEEMFKQQGVARRSVEWEAGSGKSKRMRPLAQQGFQKESNGAYDILAAFFRSASHRT